MKNILLLLLLLPFMQGHAQIKEGRTGILEYGNASIDLSHIDKKYNNNTSPWSWINNLAFSEDEEYIYYKRPDNGDVNAWNLITGVKSVIASAQLEKTAANRKLLSFFTPTMYFPLGREPKKEAWLSDAYKMVFKDYEKITITDTTGKVVGTFTLPEAAALYKKFNKKASFKGQTFGLFSFWYYAPGNTLYVLLNMDNDYQKTNRSWQIDIAKNTVMAIGVKHDTAATDFSQNLSYFAGNNIVYYSNVSSYTYTVDFTVVAMKDGGVIASGTFNTNMYGTKVVGYDERKDELFVLTDSLRNFALEKFSTHPLVLKEKVAYEIGKTYDQPYSSSFPILISPKGKYFGFSVLYDHPSVGLYCSVNYDFLDYARYGNPFSINDNTIHAPFITKSYADAKLEYEQKKAQEKIDKVNRIKAQQQIVAQRLKAESERLLNYYNKGQLGPLLTDNIWHPATVGVEFTRPRAELDLRGPEPMNLMITYDIRFGYATGTNYFVTMYCTEEATAYVDHSFANKQSINYSETYYEPAKGSYTLIRNKDLGGGSAWWPTFDKPNTEPFVEYLNRYTGQFSTPSFDVVLQSNGGNTFPVLQFKFAKGSVLPVYTKSVYEDIYQIKEFDSQIKLVMKEE